MLIGYKTMARSRINLGGVKCRLMTMMYLQIAAASSGRLSLRRIPVRAKCEIRSEHSPL
jgi:hypothetical protein